MTEEEKKHIQFLRDYSRQAGRGKIPQKYADHVRWITKAKTDASALQHYRRAHEVTGGDFTSWMSQKFTDLHNAFVKPAAQKVATVAKTAASGVKSAVSRVAAAAAPGLRLDYPPQVRALLAQIGPKHVQQLLLGRAALGGMMQKVLNLMSMGGWNKAKASMPYDDIFHLFFLIMIDNRQYLLEKNEVIVLKPYTGEEAQRKLFSTQLVELQQPFSLNTFLSNGVAYMTPEKYFVYNAWNNNCQVYVDSVMKANAAKGLVTYTAAESNWVKQNTDSITSAMGPALTSIGVAGTNLLHRANILIHGKGFNPVHVMRLHHYVNHDTPENLKALPNGSLSVLRHMLAHIPPFSPDAQAKLAHLTSAPGPGEFRSRIGRVNESGGIRNNTGQSYRVGELLNGVHEAAPADGSEKSHEFVDFKGVTGNQDTHGLLSNIPLHAATVLDEDSFREDGSPRHEYWWTDASHPDHTGVFPHPSEVHEITNAINGEPHGGAMSEFIRAKVPDKPASVVIYPDTARLRQMDGFWLPDDALASSGTPKLWESGSNVPDEVRTSLREKLVSGGRGGPFSLERAIAAASEGPTIHHAADGTVTEIPQPMDDIADDAIGGGFFSWVKNAAKSAWHGATHLISNVGHTVSSVANDAIGAAKGIYQAGKDVYEGAKHTVQQVASLLPTPVKEFIANVVLPDVAPELYMADQAMGAATGDDPVNDFLGLDSNPSSPQPAPNPPSPPPPAQQEPEPAAAAAAPSSPAGTRFAPGNADQSGATSAALAQAIQSAMHSARMSHSGYGPSMAHNYVPQPLTEQFHQQRRSYVPDGGYGYGYGPMPPPPMMPPPQPSYGMNPYGPSYGSPYGQTFNAAYPSYQPYPPY